MAGFRKAEVPREQFVLWSQRLEDSIPLDHPVRHVDYLLNSKVFAETFREWERSYVLLEGKPPYHPRDLTALYLYGMLNRIRSSRQLEMASHNRLDVIWLLSGQHPDHSTIASFVTEHGSRLRKLFRDVLRVGIRAGLVKLDHVAVDGTKIEADASRSSVHRESTIQEMLRRVEEQIAALEREWTENEAKESKLFGDDVPWIPSEAASEKEQYEKLQSQRERLEEALATIVRRREENTEGPAPKPIASVTDPSSRTMRDKEGRRKPNYNAQIAVDTTKGMIGANDVNDHPEDSGQMTVMLERAEANCEMPIQEASADSQYNTGPELAKLESMGITGFLPDNGKPSDVWLTDTPATQALAAAQSGQSLSEEQWTALPKDAQGRIKREAFLYDAAANVYRCPMNQALSPWRTSRRARSWGEAIRTQYGRNPACRNCVRAGMCCANPRYGRVINRDQYEEYRERMHAWMEKEENRLRYRLRRQTVEPRIGLIKHVLGVRRFLHRGLEAVRTEWSLVCTAVNMGILLRNWTEVQKIL